jgi:hypothetical protein
MKAYILEVWRGTRDSWERYYINCAWPSRYTAEEYCKNTLSGFDWPVRARVVSADMPVSLPAFVARHMYEKGYASAEEAASYVDPEEAASYLQEIQ